MARQRGDMREAIARNLPEKTGKTLEEWIQILTTEGPAGGKRKERVEWLKREHGLGHGQASTVVELSQRPADYTPPRSDTLIDAQYAGDKAELRPVFDRLRSEIEGLGDDVELEAKKTYVAFSRGRQFAIVQPSTKTRVDVGLTLPGETTTDRLEPAGSFGTDRTTNRVGLRSPDEVDAELVGWLRAAYDNAA
jgi:predicted transport protein